jgi:hypothetical protein
MNIKFIFEGYFNLLRYNLFPPYRKRMNDLFEERLNICLTCDYIKKNRTCRKCGCLVDAKTKVLYEMDKEGKTLFGCPYHFW